MYLFSFRKKHVIKFFEGCYESKVKKSQVQWNSFPFMR